MTREEKLKHIQEHPEQHLHSFEDLMFCCLVNGALDLSVQQAHEQGRCDVTDGPCSCGAWH